ncbi:glycine dehydrogenase [Syncephalastrum racemosum]|uniref:Glycine cleavage system H protein n=1 Tax=Syncephalastrum racemosum TaxID=13706 RepID=A0A1X2HWK2_SYNRA|nr:glycine dehydrogenase [Syncephalastrum racemosum]
MALRQFTARVVRPYAPVLRKSATLSAFRTYATKYYTVEHEWISVDNDVGTLGVTEYAQQSLGDVVFVETPAVGQSVSVNAQIGTVESVKAVSDIYSPVSGEVTDVNEKLVEEPSLINSSPEEDGWLAKIKLSNTEELSGLLDEAAYKAHCEGEEDH